MNVRTLSPLATAIALAMPAHAVELLAALDPITVTATRQPMRASETLSDITVIEREEIERSGQSTVEELLARQPGIEMAGNGSFGANSSLFIRGTNSKHVLLLIDGMRVGSATSGDATWSRLPLSQIERIEILRGPASSLYGSDAIGGVVQVFTRQGDGPLKPYAEAGGGTYGTYSANAGFSGSQQGWRYALNVARYQTQGFNSKRNTRGQDDDRDGFENDSISGRLAYQLNPAHEVGAQFFHSDGENEFDAGADDRNRQKLSSASTFLRSQLTERWTSQLTIGQSIDDAKNSGSYDTHYKTTQTQYAWQNDLRTALGNFLLGAERLDQRVRSSTLYQEDERTNDSAQIGWQQTFGAHSLQLSSRYDDNSQFGSKTTGTAAYGYRFNRNWRTHVGYGTAFRAPSFNDLYWPYQDFGAWGSYQGNPDLKPEYAHNREATLHFETGQHHVSLTWFLNRVEDLIASSGGLNAMPVNVSNARIEGATLAYDGQIGQFNLQANYNHVDPRNEDTDTVLARRARNFGMIAIGQNLGPWDWRVEVQGSGHRYDDARNQTRLSGYGVTNLYGAYRFAPEWSVFARVNNVFDKDYTLAEGYATPGSNAFIGVRYAPR